MREIVILSGKGGTGKTSLTAALTASGSARNRRRTAIKAIASDANPLATHRGHGYALAI